MTLHRRFIGFIAVTAILAATTAAPVLASSPTPVSDAVRRHAGREGTALKQVPTLFAPRRQTRAPALLPILIGAGVGCALMAHTGAAIDSSVKTPILMCAGGAVFGGAIGSVISSR